jgi:hypothetical protein
MVQVDLELVRKVARIAALATTRFDLRFCGKVIRIAVAVSVIELLSAIALVMIWIPIYLPLLVAGAWVLWIGVIAIFWKTFARWTVEWESLRPKSLPPTSTALLSAVFASSAAVAAIPLVIILQECGS